MKTNQFKLCSLAIVWLSLLFISCSTSKKAPKSVEIESTDKPTVTIEKKAAIVGGLDALQEQLVYPSKAKKQGIEKVLKANVLVTKDGKVGRISFDSESNYGFEKAAREALHKVTFRAGERDGKPVNMYITIPVTFKL